MGLYQMGKGALKDAGYIDIKTSQWTGKDGVWGREDFICNPDVQKKAVKEYHKIIRERYLKGYHQYVGRTIGGDKYNIG
jgi:hypothetical protein